jgi:hypothetical protein
MRNLPWLLPGLAVSLLVGLALSGPIGRRLGIARAHAVALVASFGLIVSATLTPNAREPAEDVVLGACDLSRVGLIPLADLMRVSDPSLNVLLFVPLGVAIGLLPRRSMRLTFLAGAIALPFLIEAIQYAVPAIGRGCQSADVVDNLAGLAVGFVVGVVGLALAPTRLVSATAEEDLTDYHAAPGGTTADRRADRGD